MQDVALLVIGGGFDGSSLSVGKLERLWRRIEHLFGPAASAMQTALFISLAHTQVALWVAHL